MVTELLRSYLDVELLFNTADAGTTQSELELQVITQLRAQHKDDLDYVLRTILAHWSHKQRSSAALVLVDWLASVNALSAEEKALLHTLSGLRAAPNASVALRARKLLISLTLPSFNQRRLQMESALQNAVEHREAAAKLQARTHEPRLSLPTSP